MRFTIAWHDAAEQDLAQIWLSFADREQITQAANAIDNSLSSDPLRQGEDFHATEFWLSFHWQ